MITLNNCTSADVRAALALDDVTVSPGSVMTAVPDCALRPIDVLLPAGRTLVMTGATGSLAGVLNNVADTDNSAIVGFSAPGARLIGGTLRGPADRTVPGARANSGHKLIYCDNAAAAINGQVIDVTLTDGPNQALQMNNTDGMLFRRLVVTKPTVAPRATGAFLGHYVDIDVTAAGRQTRNVVFQGGSYSGFGNNESVKIENGNNIVFEADPETGLLGVFNSPVLLVQDAGPKGYLDNIVINGVFYSYVVAGNLRRRWNGAAYDNLGGGNVMIRGRFVGDDAFILGGLSSASIVAADFGGSQFNADAAMNANLRADACSFEGRNSHLVAGINGTAWMTRCSGIKPKVTLYVRNAGDPKYAFALTLPAAAGAVGGAGAGNAVSGIATALTPENVSTYSLASRGVIVSLPAEGLAGANNISSSFATNVNVPIDWVADGDGCAIIVTGNAPGFGVTGSNNAKQRFINVRPDGAGAAGPAARPYVINNVNADVELYGVVGSNFACTGNGAGGRWQAYAAGLLGPGCESRNCDAVGNSGGAYQIDQSGTAVVRVEGFRSFNCHAGVAGGGGRISSPYAQVVSQEIINCAADAGVGGLFVTWAVAGVTTQVIAGVSGRGNAGSAGAANDLAFNIGTAGSKSTARGCHLASGGLVLTKTGAGGFDYGELAYAASSTMTINSGTALGGDVTTDPLLVDDTSTTKLKPTSPLRNAATPQWTVGTTRPVFAPDGAWFPVTSGGKTTIGARP